MKKLFFHYNNYCGKWSFIQQGLFLISLTFTKYFLLFTWLFSPPVVFAILHLQTVSPHLLSQCNSPSLKFASDNEGVRGEKQQGQKFPFHSILIKWLMFNFKVTNVLIHVYIIISKIINVSIGTLTNKAVDFDYSIS